MHIDYTLTQHDDGYRPRDWFRGGQQTLDAASAASTTDEADRILRDAYLGADVDGVEVRWSIPVSIYRRMDDDRWLWSGDGHIDGGIADCPADLGEDVYEALDAEIDGKGSGSFIVEVEGQEFRVDVGIDR